MAHRSLRRQYLTEDDLKATSKYVSKEFKWGNKRKTHRKSRVWLCSAQLVYVYKYNEICHSITFDEKNSPALMILNWIFEYAFKLNGLLPYENLVNIVSTSPVKR